MIRHSIYTCLNILCFFPLDISIIMKIFIVFILLTHYFSCIHGEEKTIRRSLVFKAILRHTDCNPYQRYHLRKYRMAIRELHSKRSNSKIEKPQFDETTSITWSLCLKSHTEVEGCAIALVIKSPRAQNTFCLDNPGNSNSSA